MIAMSLRRSASLLLITALAGSCGPAPGSAMPTTAPIGSGADSSGSAVPSPSSAPSFVRPTPTPMPTFLVYVVKAGDSLTRIASQLRTSARSIAYWNRAAYPSLDPESGAYAPDRIAVGWQLQVIPGAEVDEDALPGTGTAGPGSAGPASPTPSGAGPVVSPPAGVARASTVVRHGPRDSSVVALTFELSGSLDPAVDIMDALIEQRVHASIFTTGETGTMTEDGLAVLDLVPTHDDLFSLGALAWSYLDLRGLDDAAIRDQLERTEAAVVAAVNVSTKPWFRPPYGELDDQIPATAGATGWAYTVLWDVDPLDGRPVDEGGPSAEQIVERVLDEATGGSIIRLHLGGENTFEALPDIVDGLESRGLRPVTLAEMFPD